MKGKRIGHTFTKHGSHNTHELTRESQSSGRPVGQWLDDAAAEQFIASKLSELTQGAKTFDLPPGLGRQINPDGTFTPANKVTLVPRRWVSRPLIPLPSDITMNADQQILSLSEELGLKYERQDWGIVNADAARVVEFIRFCEKTKLTAVQQYALGELVLASMNETLLENRADEETLREFRRFLTSNIYGLSAHIHYWASLADSDEFPLAALLKQSIALS